MEVYRNVISEKIRHLTNGSKVIFALLICEKLWHNYVFFSEKSKFGNPSELAAIISDLYKNPFKNNNISLDDYVRRIESITPDTDNYDTILVSFALDACTSVLSTLYFLKDSNIEHITDVAIYATDTVDMYIQERDDLDTKESKLEMLIEQDFFMQSEKKRQIQVIEYLKNIDSITQKNLEDLRNLGTQSIIDLNLL